MSKRVEREKKDEQTRAKTESQQRQNGSPSVSSRNSERHEKDESGGSKENTTKEQSNYLMKIEGE